MSWCITHYLGKNKCVSPTLDHPKGHGSGIKFTNLSIFHRLSIIILSNYIISWYGKIFNYTRICSNYYFIWKYQKWVLLYWNIKDLFTIFENHYLSGPFLALFPHNIKIKSWNHAKLILRKKIHGNTKIGYLYKIFI